MAPAAKQQRTQQQYRSGTDNKPYRRGVTLGKAMRRGKLAQGPPPTSSARGKPVEGAVKGGATKGKGKAPAPLQVDSASEEGDEEMGEDEEGDVQGSEGDDDSEGEGAGPVQRAAPVAASGKRRVPRKAGGAGKKQKTFVEEKSDLLSLAASISGQAEAKKQERLERLKSKPAAPVKPAGKEPSAAKQKQLAAARAIVAARSKANKESKRAAAAPKPAAPAPAEGGRKRVSFA